ncbi:MAG: DUF6473 family protein [Pseudomonadota bacterium]
MAEMGLGRALLDIEPCRYGYSRLTFRGPEADTSKPYIAFLGATETVGPFLKRPFPHLVSETLGMGCANLGIKNAGTDVFLSDADLLRVAKGAEAVVIEVMGAANLSNAFYEVHPRRNDRFVRAHDALYERAPGLDLVDVHFTGHLMREIRSKARHVVADVITELQACWIERMRALMAAVEVPVHLLRFVPDKPGDPAEAAFVEPMMLAALAAKAASVTRIKPSLEARANGTSEMFFTPSEAAIALNMQSAATHREAAGALSRAIKGDMKKARTG